MLYYVVSKLLSSGCSDSMSVLWSESLVFDVIGSNEVIFNCFTLVPYVTVSIFGDVFTVYRPSHFSIVPYRL